MKRKLNGKMVILTNVLVLLLVLLGTTTSNAVLQANSTTHASPVSKIGSDWINQIRGMETSGQTMGLTETLNGLNATSQSNNIDVHMMLPTEYGAIAILSASGYGNSGKLRDESNAQKRTTTGNSTGVYFTGDRWEWMASTNVIGVNKYNCYDTSRIGSIQNTSTVLGWHTGAANVGLNDDQMLYQPIKSWVMGGVRII